MSKVTPDQRKKGVLWSDFWSFVRALFHCGGRNFWVVIALSVLAGAAESIGLITLIPLLVTSLDLSLTGEFSPATEWALALLEITGLPLTLVSALGIFVVAACLRALIPYASETKIERLRLEFVNSLRSRLFQNIVRARWSVCTKLRTSDEIYRLMQASLSAGQAAVLTYRMTGRVLLLTLHCGLIYLISPVAFGVSLAAIALGATLVYPSLRQSNRIGMALRDAQSSAFDAAASFLTVLRTTKMAGIADRQLEKFEIKNRKISDQFMNFTRRHQGFRAGFQIAIALFLAAFLILTISTLGRPGVEVLVMVAVFARLAPNLINIIQDLQIMLSNLPAHDVIVSEIDRLAGESDPTDHQAKLASPKYSITLENIGFGYGRRINEVQLSGIRMEIYVNQITALAGKTGAGKTTLADIISGLLEPDTGQVLLDHKPLKSAQLPAWRRMVGYVPQDGVLLDASIRENLTWALDDYSSADLERVISVAGLDSLVYGLPEQLETRVGPNGALLSGGECQRILLARELLRKPEILILDEATSALDEETERSIHDALRSLHGQLTIFLIAHRSSSIILADRVYLLEEGSVRLVEQTQILDEALLK